MTAAIKTMSVFRRVKKADVVIVQVPKVDPVEICLDCWKLWMLKDDRDLSASRMKLDSGGYDDGKEKTAYESDPNEEQRKADIKIGAATNTAINNLSAAHRWAMQRKCGISKVWRFPNLDYMTTAIEATEELTKKLRLDIDTGHLFV